jgi:hypothetical protein
MRRAALSFLTLLTVMVSSASTEAKDLGNRFGLGVQTQLGSVPALSVRYGLPMANPAVNIQVEADIGFSTEDTGALLIGGRGLYAMVVEDNMNLYGFIGAAYNDDGVSSAFRIKPGVEVQAFPFGLENLGLTGSFGINLDLGAPSSVSTAGAVAAGLHYWF